MKSGEPLRNVIVGAIVGVFMILPGASGATAAILFGVYERLIRDISRLREFLLKDFFWLLTLGIGVLIGVIVCSKGLDMLIKDYEIPLMFFFAVLIFVQLPDLWKETDDGNKLTGMNILAGIGGLAVMIVVLAIGIQGLSLQGDTGAIIMFFAGVIYAICAIAPGISGSTVLLALGMFTAVVESVGNLEFGSIIPLGIGALIGTILFAKAMDHFFAHNRKSTYCAIFGLTLGSVVTVVTQAFIDMKADGDYLVPSIVAIAVGLILGYGLHRLTRYMAAKGMSE
jgi:putative membrane protein